MLKELVEKIGALAVEAHGVEVVTPPGEPKHRYAIRKPDGTLEWFEATPPPRQHAVRSVEALVDVARHFKEDGCLPTCWYSRTGVVLVVNEMAGRRDRVTLPLGLSVPLTDLMLREAKRQPVGQAQLVSLLRTTLARCVRGNLLEMVRRVNFSQSAAGHGELHHGKSSIGKSLQAELTGAAALPENVTFDVPVFSGHFHTVQPVECALEVAPETQTFTLVPIPGDIERAVALGEAALGSRLAAGLKDEVSVFYGEP